MNTWLLRASNILRFRWKLSIPEGDLSSRRHRDSRTSYLFIVNTHIIAAWSIVIGKE